MSETKKPKNFGVVLFPGFQLLDVCGPLDALNVLSTFNTINLSIIAATRDPVGTHHAGQDEQGSNFNQRIVPTHTFEDAPKDLEVLIIPGGLGNRVDENMKPVVAYLTSLGLSSQPQKHLRGDIKWILTVCTGSEILARTGALDGRRATTNKRAFNEVKTKHPNVKWVTKARWVVDGEFWTSSGISAGIDLTFAWMSEIFGEETAQYVADRSEYERNTDSTNDRSISFNSNNMAHTKKNISTAILLFFTTSLAAPLAHNPVARASNKDPSCAPGGNFELKAFNLQLPTGSSGKVDQISGSKLSGCDGWSSPTHFYTSSSGTLVMKVPSRSDCVTTPNSKHCRTELREASPKSWDPKNDVNLLKARLSVPKPDDSKYGTVVGQVKVDDSVSKKPVAELFYNRAGTLTIGVSQIPDVSSLKMTEIGNVAVGATFQYELRYEGGKLSVRIDDGEQKIMSTGKLNSPKSYFKVGNYNQGKEPSEVVFHDIEIGQKSGVLAEFAAPQFSHTHDPGAGEPAPGCPV
ncbi:hypothetical protein OPT61_g1013 [Boeremia exigua]|uniref:Uncharacterized protein n=1 Tax=Boeremia exigua TaxID=749465 RepID=A0ACC2IRQ9_9PLEO|nr:hypothetical protein OPT61_g1013 [Boeremia exigua]